jgi:hypothetical protein
MKLGRLNIAALAVALSASCDTFGKDEPSWVGVYTLRADTVRYCTETTTASGRTCDCTAPGHLEGTLSLSADDDEKPTGQLHLQECPPGAACGTLTSYPIVAYVTSNPNPPAGLSFCAGRCPFADNGGMQFAGAAIPANPLTGFFSRADGNVRGCGADAGVFTATRR